MPKPKNTRDLWLLSEASTKAWPEHIIDSLWYTNENFEYTEGALLRTYLHVYPMQYKDNIEVHVFNEYVHNPKILGPQHIEYNTIRELRYTHTYTFEEFKNSPFWQMTLDAWKTNNNFDTSKLDDSHATIDTYQSNMLTHYLKSYTDCLGNERISGDIGSIDITTDIHGNITIIANDQLIYDNHITELIETIQLQDRINTLLTELKSISNIEVDGSQITIDL